MDGSWMQVFSAWMHLCAIRIFIESILRYGLPPAFLVRTFFIPYDECVAAVLVLATFDSDSNQQLCFQRLNNLVFDTGSRAGPQEKEWGENSSYAGPFFRRRYEVCSLITITYETGVFMYHFLV
jgi:hypothetical protein